MWRDIVERTGVKYALMAILPLALLIYTPVANYAVLLMGERVLLETLPVDPRDLLRGDYVNLSYKIETIDVAMVPESLREQRGEHEVYVALKTDEAGVASVSGISLGRPAAGKYIRAKFIKSGWQHDLTCTYNLGVYYVPEGTGLALERAINSGVVLADVRLWRGRGVIKKLEIVPQE